MDLWTLNWLLFFGGLSFEVAALLLLFSADRAPLLRSAISLLLIAIPLQIGALFVPQILLASYWFILGAMPLLLPAPLFYRAQRRGAPALTPTSGEPQPQGTAAKATHEEFQAQLELIREVVAAHPEGLTLVEIGKELDVEWRRLTGAVKELMERGQLRKEGKRYFHAGK
jgi:hypothetical protein